MVKLSPLTEILDSKSMKPYGKLSRLLHEALISNLITEEEFERFDEELRLLLHGNNRSAITHPRTK